MRGDHQPGDPELDGLLDKIGHALQVGEARFPLPSFVLGQVVDPDELVVAQHQRGRRAAHGSRRRVNVADS